MEDAVKKAIWALDEEQVKTFLFEMTMQIDEVADYLSLYIKQIDKSSSIEEVIREKLSLICKKHDRENDYCDYGYSEWYSFGNELEELCKSILLSSGSDTVKVILITEMLVELSNRDDISHDGYSHDILDDILMMIEDHISSASFKNDLRPILKQIWHQTNGNGLINEVAKDYWEIWATSAADIKEVEHRMRSTALDADSAYQVSKYCDYLASKGRVDEVIPFLMNERERQSVRQVLIEKAILNHEYTLAEKVIREALTGSTRQRYLNNALLTLGEKSNNKALALEAAERQFKESSGFKEYLLLKKWHDKKSWSQRSLTIIEQVKKSRSYANTYTLADIYSEENMLKELSEILLIGPVDLCLLQRHYKKLIKTHPQEILDRFVRGVREYVKGPADPKSYEYSITLLKTMNTLPKGKMVVQELKGEFMETYKRRTKFTAMLNLL